MAMAASAGLNLGPVYKLTGRQLIAKYLLPTAGSGKLSDAILPGDCSVAAGVDVFSASPNALPFQPSHRGQRGEVWGYFAAAKVADSIQPAPGGCWVRHGEEKPYVIEGETVGYRSSFAFHVTRVEGDGEVLWAPTRWMMKEYRLDNTDFVIRKVFTKPVSVPHLLGKAFHAPLPPYARSEGAMALRLQQGGRGPKPVAPPPTTKAIATAVAPPRPQPQIIATAVVPRPLLARFSDEAAKSAAARASWAFKIPSGRHVIAHCLGPKAIHGQLPGGVTPGFVAEGVDVFAVNPDALPFPASHRKQNGEVWGYFFAAKPTAMLRAAHGGCWVHYGIDKKYCVPGAAGHFIACHRRFAYHAARVGGDGEVAWEQTRWLMKEYRLNKDAPAARKVRTGPGANMDLVVLKVFRRPMPVVAPPPRPAWSGVDGLQEPQELGVRGDGAGATEGLDGLNGLRAEVATALRRVPVLAPVPHS